MEHISIVREHKASYLCYAAHPVQMQGYLCEDNGAVFVRELMRAWLDHDTQKAEDVLGEAHVKRRINFTINASTGKMRLTLSNIGTWIDIEDEIAQLILDHCEKLMETVSQKIIKYEKGKILTSHVPARIYQNCEIGFTEIHSPESIMMRNIRFCKPKITMSSNECLDAPNDIIKYASAPLVIINEDCANKFDGDCQILVFKNANPHNFTKDRLGYGIFLVTSVLVLEIREEYKILKRAVSNIMRWLPENVTQFSICYGESGWENYLRAENGFVTAQDDSQLIYASEYDTKSEQSLWVSSEKASLFGYELMHQDDKKHFYYRKIARAKSARSAIPI